MIIRQEKEQDYFTVENLVREAFWNVYRPGCSEHLVLHNFRLNRDFIKDLDLVLEDNNKIVAQIMYSKANIILDNRQKLDIITFGPISVLPEYQKLGYGEKIINYSIDKATKLVFGAIAITGNPNYYNKFGFVDANNFGVYYLDLPKTEKTPFFMIKELKQDYLKNCSGRYYDPDGYNVNQNELDEFDKQFPLKIKEKHEGQLE